jgi:hypothetical protein
MDNRLIFLYHVSSVNTDGGTGKDKRTVALVVHGQPGRTDPRKIRGPLSPRGDVSRLRPASRRFHASKKIL